MDPDAVKSTLSNLAFRNVLAASARDYKKEVLANEKAQASNHVNEVEKLHAYKDFALRFAFQQGNRDR